MDGERHLQDVSTALVAGAVFSLFVGVIANTGVHALTPNLVGGCLAVISTVAVALAVWVHRRGSWRTGLAKLDQVAIERIAVVLSNSYDSDSSLKPSLSLELSVKPVGEHDSPDLPISQEASAFVAALTSEPTCTVVTGQAGAGKSTLLHYLALRMAEARRQGATSYTPLLLSCRDWTRQSELTNWASSRCLEVYGIPTQLTRTWFRRGVVLLVLDGADEIENEAWPSFRIQVNRWLSSPVGGPIVVSCRHDAYLDYFRCIRHEKVASLQPLSSEEIRRYLSQIAEEQAPDGSPRTEVTSLLSKLLLDTPEYHPNLLTPLLIRMITDGMQHLPTGGQDGPGDSQNDDAATDPMARIMRIGDSLSRSGHQTTAIDLYMAAVDGRSPTLRSQAVVRASALLARSGDQAAARQALERSLAVEIEQPLHRTFLPIREHLSDDERDVLRLLREGQILDAFQISSRTLIPPTRCSAALRRLRERGLIDVLDGEGKKEPRFQRSVVELIGH